VANYVLLMAICSCVCIVPIYFTSYSTLPVLCSRLTLSFKYCNYLLECKAIKALLRSIYCVIPMKHRRLNFNCQHVVTW